MFDLTGKVAVVTGGDSGIGLGFAHGLAIAGANVCILGNDPARHDAACAALRAHGGQVAAIACDIADEAQVDTAFAQAVARFGRVDGCFANAGLSGGTGAAAFASMVLDDWRRMIDVNLTGTFLTLRAAARHMTARSQKGDSGGRLVATASLAAITGAAYTEHYAAAKAGVVALTNGLAVELAPYGITANAILPGFIATPMTAELFRDGKPFEQVVRQRVPLRRAGTPDDFSAIAVYLMSNASGYHTGDTFRIDGGYFLA